MDTTDAGKFRDETKEKDGADFIETTIGGRLGRWQIRICFLMCLLKLSITWYDVSIIYFNPTTKFLCNPPPRFNDTDIMWRNHLISSNDVKIKYDSCTMKIIDNSNEYTVPCLWGFKYNTSVIHSSIVTEWNLVCNKKYLANLSQTILMFGETIGSIGFGFAADKFGRKKIIICTIVLSSLFSALLAVVQTYTVFLVYKFLIGLCIGGLAAVAMVLNIEVIGNSYRVVANNVFQSFMGLGYITMAGLAYFLRDWRQLEWAFTFFNVLCISYIYLIDESPRWLLLQGDQTKIKALLVKISKINKRSDSVNLDELQIPNRMKDKRVDLMSLYKIPRVRKNTLILSFAWLIVGTTCFGIVQYVGQATPDIYLSAAINGVFFLPGNIIATPLIKIYGSRRVALFGLLLVPFEYMILLYVTTTWIKLLIFAVNFFVMAVYVAALLLLTNEMYPTVLRNSGAGFCLTFGRIGAVIAPFILTQDACNPLWIFIFLSIWQPILIIPLSETDDKNLYETIEDLEI